MYFGAHVKASGGVWTAVERGEALGVHAIQFFAGSPRTWKPQLYREADAARFRESRAASSLRFAVIHTIYLINLASAKEDFYEKSVTSLAGAVAAAEQLGADAIVTHVGSHQGAGFEAGLERVQAALRRTLSESEGSPVRLLLENTAGEHLLLLRAKPPNLGIWSPIGGKLEMALGESPFECAIRETFEETGLRIGTEDLHLFSMIAEKAYEGQSHWLMFLFCCRRRLDVALLRMNLSALQPLSARGVPAQEPPARGRPAQGGKALPQLRWIRVEQRHAVLVEAAQPAQSRARVGCGDLVLRDLVQAL